MTRAEQIIRILGLEPLPQEGGLYRETYRSDGTIPREALPECYDGDRCYGTAIYYLLTAGVCSRLHRLRSDEIFHFHLGDPVEMLQLHPDGTSRVVLIGTDLAAGQRPQVVVPAGTWQGAVLREGGEFALLSVTVAPGFEFADYEPADAEALIARYGDRAEWIRRLTPPGA